MFDILWICLTYCIGSVPFGLVFAKTFCRIDPRTAGSGNVGATNVARLCGKAWGAATLACDLLKGAIPVFVAMQYSTSELVWTLTALAAILGHLYSCFLGFKGGKAVATSIGVLIPLAFWQLLIAVCICLFLIWRSGFVSLGSRNGHAHPAGPFRQIQPPAALADHPRAGLLEPPRKHPPSRQGRGKDVD